MSWNLNVAKFWVSKNCYCEIVKKIRIQNNLHEPISETLERIRRTKNIVIESAEAKQLHKMFNCFVKEDINSYSNKQIYK